MTTENFSFSEISKKGDSDDDVNILKRALQLISDLTEKAKHQKGFYYTEKLELLNYKNIKEFYFCNECNKSYIFYIDAANIINLNTISYSCNCVSKKIISIEDLDNLMVDIDKIKNQLVCSNCGNEFHLFYMKNNENICKNCSIGKYNIKELNKFETLSMFNNLNYLIFFVIDEDSQKIVKEGKREITDKNCEDKKEKLKSLYKLKKMIVTSIINYMTYPNYNVYLTIQNLCEGFSEYSQIPNLPNDVHYFKKIIEINRNKKKLINLKPQLNNFVTKVDVRQLKFHGDLIEKYIVGKFNNLIELNLAENCLYSIKFLLNTEWNNLKILILFSNKLGDENIPYIENLNAKDLISLNLEFNDFTNYELLLAIGNNKHGSFKKLEELQIGFNNFKIEKKNTKNFEEVKIGNNNYKILEKKNKKKSRKNLEELVKELIKLDFSSIRVLDAKNGGLPQKAFENILPALRLKNYENVDIRYNDITNIKFINGNKYNKNLFFEGNFIPENKEKNQ